MSERSRQPLGFALRDAYRWHDLAALARMGEDAGFDALFLPEVGARDTLATLAALAGETSRLRLGTGVVPLPSRSPALLAIAAATVQELSGGRLVLGLGTGPSGPGALDRLRATVGALREAFAGGTGKVEGLPVGSPLPLATAPQVWIAALGPRATALAGEIATGSCSNWCTPERVAAAVTQIAEGARAAGRDPPTSPSPSTCGRRSCRAASNVRPRDGGGRTGRTPRTRGSSSRWASIRPIPDAIIAGSMLTDPAGSATARLDAYRAAGAHLPVVYPVLPPGGPSADAARSTLGAVAPA